MESFLQQVNKYIHLATNEIKFQDVYKQIYASTHFPFWFVIQAIWECYVVKRSLVSSSNNSSKATTKTNKRKKSENKSKNKEKETKNSENNDENSNENLQNNNSIQQSNENSNKENKINEHISSSNEEKKKKILGQLRKIFDLFLCFILCFAMNFFPREIFAFSFKMPSPIKKNNSLIILFAIIFVLIFCFPFDITFKIIHFKPCSFILGFLQGANQARFFRITLRNAPKFLIPEQYVPIVAGFLSLDVFINFLLSPLLNRKGRRTYVSNGNTICNYVLFCIIYLTLTVPNNFSRDFLHSIKLNDIPAALFIAFTLGIYNGINALRNDHK